MTRSEVVDLLTLIAAYDQRTVGRADVEAWAEIADLEHWTWPLARRAVIEHNRSGGDRPRIRPAHITDAIRDVERVASGAASDALRTSIAPPRELADDPAAEIAWRRAFIAQAKHRALNAWADGQTPPELQAPVEAMPGARQLVDTKGDAGPALRRLAAATLPAEGRREPVDPNDRARQREIAEAELDAIRGRAPEPPPIEATR
jgi:hypothetical protein